MHTHNNFISVVCSQVVKRRTEEMSPLKKKNQHTSSKTPNHPALDKLNKKKSKKKQKINMVAMVRTLRYIGDTKIIWLHMKFIIIVASSVSLCTDIWNESTFWNQKNSKINWVVNSQVKFQQSSPRNNAGFYWTGFKVRVQYSSSVIDDYGMLCLGLWKAKVKNQMDQFCCCWREIFVTRLSI